MAKYTNIAVALGNQSGNGSSKTFTFSASSINSLVNNTLPSECKITRAVIQFRGAKPYSFSGKGSITITLGSYSKSYSDVIANDGTNDDFGSGDTLCTSDDIKGYINSNGRFNSDLIFKLGSSTLSTYWRVEATIYFDYETPSTVSVSCGAGGTISSTGGSYYTGTTFTVTATPNMGYKFKGWANSSGVIAVQSNPYSFAVSGDTGFSAVFEPITYYVSYNANGGSGTIDTASVQFGNNYTLVSNTFTAPKVTITYEWEGGSTTVRTVTAGKTFLGWEDWGDITANTGRVLTADKFDAPYYVQHPNHTDLLQILGYNKFSLASHYVNDGEREGRPCLSTNGVRGAYAAGLTVNSLGSTDGATVHLKAQWSGANFTLPGITKDGCKFLGWLCNGSLYQTGDIITLNADAIAVAQWEKPTCTLTVKSNADAYGTVTGGGTYAYGKEVTLTATPNSGYRFKQWSDGVTTATRTVTVTGAATYTAVFELIPPEIKSVQMIYLDKQISSTNKVPCGEGFIISVELS